MYIESPARHVIGYKEWSLASSQRAHFGLPAEGKKRWCAGCAKGHTGAEDLMDRRRNIKKR